LRKGSEGRRRAASNDVSDDEDEARRRRRFTKARAASNIEITHSHLQNIKHGHDGAGPIRGKIEIIHLVGTSSRPDSVNSDDHASSSLGSVSIPRGNVSVANSTTGTPSPTPSLSFNGDHHGTMKTNSDDLSEIGIARKSNEEHRSTRCALRYTYRYKYEPGF
jgi:hypothetical protein